MNSDNNSNNLTDPLANNIVTNNSSIPLDSPTNIINNVTNCETAPLSPVSSPFSNLKGFKVGHLNITSLTKHLDELLVYMQDQPFDILTMNETRLDNSVRDNEVEIPGYDIIRKDRNRNGGGVAVYIRKNITFANRNNLVPVALEAICIEINKPKSKPLLVATWYRPPNSKTELFQHFEKFLELIDDEKKELVITGDLNCDFLQSNENQQTKKLIGIMNTFQLQQHITTPTRITAQSQTLIDVILTYTDDKFSVPMS